MAEKTNLELARKVTKEGRKEEMKEMWEKNYERNQGNKKEEKKRTIRKGGGRKDEFGASGRGTKERKRGIKRGENWLGRSQNRPIWGFWKRDKEGKGREEKDRTDDAKKTKKGDQSGSNKCRSKVTLAPAGSQNYPRKYPQHEGLVN